MKIRQLGSLVLFSFLFAVLLYTLRFRSPRQSLSSHQHSLLEKCRYARTPAGPPSSYHPSSRVIHGSDRFEFGTPPTLIRNASILTGRVVNGTEAEIVHGDILLNKGVIISIGHIPSLTIDNLRDGKLVTIDADGKWVTPGLVDLHSHLGGHSAPQLAGSTDGNSHKAPILPWLRSIDGLNTHDESYALALAGGVTTVQVLPGSANNIGGQAVVIKLRPPPDRSVSSRVVEPPRGLFINASSSPEWINWRHMKHACGENPDRGYSLSRMDAAWNFRNAYNQAKKLKDAQDEFCAHVEERNWDLVDEFSFGQTNKGEFPEDLQWESLSDVLRGRVKLSIHCYEAVDLDMIVRLSNEFKFPVASFHHAGETYLVPDLLKKTWGGTPSIALFASNARKKREAYRGSEFAPSILAENNISVVMKSDHPVLNSRYLIYEAQQAFYYSLPAGLALASVTSTPASTAGLGHRIGMLRLGYDADIVLWDSHPLALGATPEQVWIDGIRQFPSPYVVTKPKNFQKEPKVPNWEKEKKRVGEYDGLPPLDQPNETIREGIVKFVNVKSLWTRNDFSSSGVRSEETGRNRTVVFDRGEIVCVSLPDDDDNCSSQTSVAAAAVRVVDLEGGAIAPGLTSFGSQLGLTEILLEPSTNDGNVLDPLQTKNPVSDVVEQITIKAVDGVQFGGRNLLLAYRGGVTTAITAPSGEGFFRGVGVAFRSGALNKVHKGAILREETALHVSVNPNIRGVSVSTQVALLRRLLFHPDKHGEEDVWRRVREGKIPLVVHVNSADIMTTLIALKSEYEYTTRKTFEMTFVGGAEAHLIADEIAMANVSVVLVPVRPFPQTWDKRRILPGPPLSKESAVTTLFSKGINVGIGVADEFDARNSRFDVGWVALESNGTISQSQALALVTSNLEKALGLNAVEDELDDLVLYKGGGIFEMKSKVVGVVKRGEGVELF